MTGPQFDEKFREQLYSLFQWRRDVRSFRSDLISTETLLELLNVATLAPSVGNSQPWRFVLVEDDRLRESVRENFRRENQAALEDYENEDAQKYARLKLSGLEEAPVHLAVFVDECSKEGKGLGARTMPEVKTYSVILSIHTLWLAARARGIGLGWVSILDPQKIQETLGVPARWKLVGYFCLGYPAEENDVPELERLGWQDRKCIDEFLTIL